VLDLLIQGGLVVDGTGRSPKHADVGVRAGRVVTIGTVDEPATRTVDASDHVVAPGFIDIHTHYDAQAFWDPTLSPSPLHGVTTVIGGNCGFSIAPLTPTDADYLMRMLSRVEGMPLESLQAGTPWDWRSTADYLDRLDGTLVPNTGFLVGHSALRAAVMHDDAVGKQATPAQVEAMRELLADGLRAGGLGFSSTWSRTHNDHEGNPVPSRHSSREELLTLCAEVSEHPGTMLEFIPEVGQFDDDTFELMGVMSRVADRPLNWNVLVVHAKNGDVVQHQLAGSDLASTQGGRVLALTLPDSLRQWINFKSGFVFDVLPGWDSLMALPDDRKLAMMADPSGRAEMDRLAQSALGPIRSIANWSGYVIVETFTEDSRRFTGMTVGQVARALGASPWDALASIVVGDGLRTVVSKQDTGQDDESWARRVEVWRDPRTIVGGSDAGAHLDMIDSFSFSTTLLGQAVRQRSLLPVEEAVHYLTGAPAALYGLKDRGTLAPGSWADIVVFDPAAVGPGSLTTRHDLPAGAGRIYGEAEGVARVFVAGEEVVAGGEFTDARPGTMLRSGRDTTTVTAQ
jgi:N-acyl-D-aspartate/D-glutamate deacylase